MTFSFSWVTAHTIHTGFDPQIHNSEDEKVFSLEIRQREGGLATAQIVVKNPKVGLLGKARKLYGVISHNQELLFCGRVVGMPVHIEGEAVRLLLVAQPKDYHQQLQQLMQSLKVAPYWDELFVSSAAKERPLEVLEARSELYYCSRTSGKVSISDLFTGSQHINLAGNFFRDSLQVRVAEAPLFEIDVELTAQWSQQGYGTFDATSQLLSQFPYGLISTYTGKDLESKWWKAGEKIGRTGYWVDSSYLQEVSPPYTGVLNLYPKVSPKIWGPPSKKGDAPQQVRLKRHWYQAELRLGWRYQQTRSELARFTLKHATQPLMPTSARKRRLRLRLQKVVGLSHSWRANHGYTAGFRVVYADKVYRCQRRHRSGNTFESQYWSYLGSGQHSDPQSHRPSFFTTDRGRQAIQHAIERAKAHLAASARAISIKVQAPFEILQAVTTDHCLTLEDDRLPGGQATGKVVSYRLCAEGNTGKRWVEVEIGVSIGAGKTLSGAKEIPTGSAYVEGNYLQPGAELEDWQRQIPTQGVLYPSGLRPRDLVNEVEVSYQPDAQLQHLLHNQYPKSLNLKHTLLQKPTDLCLRLKDLSTEACLLHEIEIPILQPWSPPRQIDLESE